jgi:hypothetical protein
MRVSSMRTWAGSSVVAAATGKSSRPSWPAGEDPGFDGAGALEAPAAFSDGLGDVDFEDADGGEGFADAFAVNVEGGLLSGGENVDLAGESVFVGVEPGALHAGLASGGGWPGGLIGKPGVEPGHGLGDCLLLVEHRLVPLFTEEHGEIGMLRKERRLRLGNFIFGVREC